LKYRHLTQNPVGWGFESNRLVTTVISPSIGPLQTIRLLRLSEEPHSETNRITCCSLDSLLNSYRDLGHQNMGSLAANDGIRAGVRAIFPRVAAGEGFLRSSDHGR